MNSEVNFPTQIFSKLSGSVKVGKIKVIKSSTYVESKLIVLEAVEERLLHKINNVFSTQLSLLKMG